MYQRYCVNVPRKFQYSLPDEEKFVDRLRWPQGFEAQIVMPHSFNVNEAFDCAIRQA